MIAVRSCDVGLWKDCRDRLDVSNARICRLYLNRTYDDIAAKKRTPPPSPIRGLFFGGEYDFRTDDDQLLRNDDYDNLLSPDEPGKALWEYFLEHNDSLSLCAQGPPARNQVSTKPKPVDHMRELRYRLTLDDRTSNLLMVRVAGMAIWILVYILAALLVLWDGNGGGMAGSLH